MAASRDQGSTSPRIAASPRGPAFAGGSPLHLLLALLFTVLNAVKPLQVDDAAYYYYAAHLAQQPLDPYGFEIFWYQWPLPANTVLAPPVLPYWWALALRLFGEHVVLWKLWLLPFAWLFVAALAALFRRFARGMERPLLLLTVLSPAFLPSLNLMLDVPALALGLAAVALFLRAGDRASPGLAVLAGLVAGLAMQTKYTAFLVPAVLVTYALLFRRLGLALLAIVVAGSVFAGWEVFVALRYGESHFLYHFRGSERSWLDLLALAPPLLSNLGGVTAALAVLGLAALGLPRGAVAAAGGVVVSGYLLLAGIPEPYASCFWGPRYGDYYFPAGSLIFGFYGATLGITLVLALGLLCRGGPGSEVRPWQCRRAELFLGLWLGLELAGYFALTPFPATRRVFGLVVVATLVLGRLASRTCRRPARRRLVWGVTAGGLVLGLLYYGVDLRDACAQKSAAEAAVARLRQQGYGTAWFVGHWSFQFYAERAGLRPVVPGQSLLRRGDWLVVPEERFEQQVIEIAPEATEPAEPIVVEDWLPLRTVRCFYGGYLPLEHHEGPRITVRLYRVTADFVPASRWR